eukprot:TRINITY_DN5523_c0_g1_i1.p1 TRINITY_DN5523_c0_g1~~TRINITY_DN5523_c0_g1_i1.p1  ORF type:complete len:465 (+),score=36.36 TRINITY_DN5523_c0_g1_i1:23-1417(+)
MPTKRKKSARTAPPSPPYPSHPPWKASGRITTTQYRGTFSTPASLDRHGHIVGEQVGGAKPFQDSLRKYPMSPRTPPRPHNPYIYDLSPSPNHTPSPPPSPTSFTTISPPSFSPRHHERRRSQGGRYTASMSSQQSRWSEPPRPWSAAGGRGGAAARGGGGEQDNDRDRESHQYNNNDQIDDKTAHSLLTKATFMAGGTSATIEQLLAQQIEDQQQQQQQGHSGQDHSHDDDYGNAQHNHNVQQHSTYNPASPLPQTVVPELALDPTPDQGNPKSHVQQRRPSPTRLLGSPPPPAPPPLHQEADASRTDLVPLLPPQLISQQEEEDLQRNDRLSRKSAGQGTVGSSDGLRSHSSLSSYGVPNHNQHSKQHLSPKALAKMRKAQQQQQGRDLDNAVARWENVLDANLKRKMRVEERKRRHREHEHSCLEEQKRSILAQFSKTTPYTVAHAIVCGSPKAGTMNLRL